MRVGTKFIFEPDRLSTVTGVTSALSATSNMSSDAALRAEIARLTGGNLSIYALGTFLLLCRRYKPTQEWRFARTKRLRQSILLCARRRRRRQQVGKLTTFDAFFPLYDFPSTTS